MKPDVVQLTKDIVAINSVSAHSNAQVSDLLEETLKGCAFEVERLEYVDDQGERKISLVGKKGAGAGGFGLFSHSDTVPGNEWAWDAFSPVVQDGRLIGRGSCDMKGPLAATVVAAAAVDANQLRHPVFVVITADEEVGGAGARQVAKESVLLNTAQPPNGIVAEPTGLVPVYAHKGGGSVIVTAHGKAAHTSTDRGISANFLIAPFLAEMAELAEHFKTDDSFKNQEFDPPTNGFNIVLNDGGCRPNVTSAKTVCTVGFRTMPDDRSDDVIALVTERARKHDLDATARKTTPFRIPPESELVRKALEVTGVAEPKTVPYGTDAPFLQDQIQLVILGPGDIAQAHTVGEWIEIDELQRAVDIYERMIVGLCS